MSNKSHDSQTADSSSEVSRVSRGSSTQSQKRFEMLFMLAPHFLLASSFVAYLLAGGIVLRLLENSDALGANKSTLPPQQQKHEGASVEKVEKVIKNLRQKFHQNIVGLIRGNAQVSGQISRRVEELERRYYEDIAAQMLTVAKPTYSADYSAPLPRKQFKWTLGNTVLYAFNLLSTIGSGDLLPEQTASKIFCFVYVLVGIPYFALCATDIGRFFSDFIHFIYRLLMGDNKRNSDDECESRRIIPLSLLICVFLAFIFIVAFVFNASISNFGESIGDVLFRTFLGIHTISFDSKLYAYESNEQWSEWSRNIFTMLLLSMGISMKNMVMDLFQCEIKRKTYHIHYFFRRRSTFFAIVFVTLLCSSIAMAFAISIYHLQ